MRILVSCLQGAQRHPIPRYQFWRGHFVNGLLEAGHEVLEVPGVDWAEGLAHPPGAALAAWRARAWQVTVSYVRSELRSRPVHLWLGYLYPQQVDCGAIAELQRLGVPCVNFFCDNVREFRRVPDEYRPFALHWVPEFEALAIYRKAGLTCVNLPMPCWVAPQLRTVPQSECEPPTFIGSADLLRRELLGAAIRMGADIVIRGAGWTAGEATRHAAADRGRSLARAAADRARWVQRHGAIGAARQLERKFRPLRPLPIPSGRLKGPVDERDYLTLTQEARVAIGINRVPTIRKPDRRPVAYSRLRDVEATMLGACYLTEWTAGLAQLFEPGAEIEVFHTAEELAEKLRDLDRDRARRFGLRRQAQRRALSEHSVAQSVRRICRVLGLSSMSA